MVSASTAFTATISGFKNGELIGTSGVTGSPTFTTNATATSSVDGNPYDIIPAIGNLSAANYDFPPENFVNGNLTITAKPISVIADPQTKEYGETDPALTYKLATGNSLIGTDAFTGSLSRAVGENAGTYAIGQGTLALSNNYTLNVYWCESDHHKG